MATFRFVLNETLRVLSEDEVDASATELDSDYHKLVASFINQIKEEIEDAHQWSSLWEDISVTIAASADTAEITGANERSRLVRIQQSNQPQPVALVFDITDSGNVALLQELDYSDIVYRRRTSPNGTTNAAPAYFATRRGADGVPDIVVYPKPLSERTLSVTMVVPQDRLEDDNLDVNLQIPSRPLLIGAIWYALEERGEELGVSNLYTEERFRRALDDTISQDWAEQGGLDLVAM
jgi:hypothetical protein